MSVSSSMTTKGRDYVRKKMPLIGIGTYHMQNENVLRVVVDAALSCGYRLFDTAQLYGNEEMLGRIFKEFLPKHNLSRADIFITSKVSPENQGTENALKSTRQSLADLQTEYIDLMLIHWPGTNLIPTPDHRSAELRKQTYIVLEELHETGVLRSIGVSNYEIRHLKQLFTYCTVLPAVNQVEFHPHFHQLDLLDFCKSHGIHLQAYCSFGGERYNGKLFQDSDVKNLATKYHITEPQFLLAWAMSQSISVIPRSTSVAHTTANFAASNIRVSPEDVDKLLKNGKCYKAWWDPTIIA